MVSTTAILFRDCRGVWSQSDFQASVIYIETILAGIRSIVMNGGNTLSKTITTGSLSKIAGAGWSKVAVMLMAMILIASPLFVSLTGSNLRPNNVGSSRALEPSHLGSVPASSAQVNPFSYYTKEPAPMGVTDFGIGAHGKPYAYQTKEFLGVANITSLSTYNASLPAGSRHWMSFQMNVVQAFVYFGTTYVYWIQDVAKVNTSTNYFSFIDNVWNLSSTAANVYASTLSGNGSVASSSGRGYYFDYASSLPGNNVSLNEK